MIFKGEKTFFFRSIFWIVFFINLSLSSFFEANGQDEIIWERYKIEKSKEDSTDDPIDTKLKKEESNFEANGQEEIVGEKYKIEKSKEDSIKIDAVNKPPTWRNRILRFSFEEIDMPDEGEYMGLYGIGAYE